MHKRKLTSALDTKQRWVSHYVSLETTTVLETGKNLKPSFVEEGIFEEYKGFGENSGAQVYIMKLLTQPS